MPGALRRRKGAKVDPRRPVMSHGKRTLLAQPDIIARDDDQTRPVVVDAYPYRHRAPGA